mgnify:CR=1 FL=1
MKSSSHDIRKEIKDYIREGHINKDKLIDHLLDFLSKDELQDFVIMYNYMTEEELSESLDEFSDREYQIIKDTIDKFYPEYRRRPIGRFLNDVQMETLSDDCYVNLDDAREEVSDADIDKMITIDEYYVGGSDNVAIVSMLNPKDGKIYRYADL